MFSNDDRGSILTDRIACPWCQARPGEPCQLQDPVPPYPLGPWLHSGRAVPRAEYDRLEREAEAVGQAQRTPPADAQ